MSFTVKGTIVEIYKPQQITERFKKREFVLEVKEGMYPEFVKLQATQDRCELLDKFGNGEEVDVNFNLRGRPYTKEGKTTYFTNLEMWRIEGVNAAEAQTTPADVKTGGESKDLVENAEGDDLPF